MVASLVHRVGTLNLAFTRLYWFPGGTACEFALLPLRSFLDPPGPVGRPTKLALCYRGEPIIHRTGL